MKKIEYKNLTSYVCDKVYTVETKTHGCFVGYMLNYYGGNVVLLTIAGVVHLPYSDIEFIIPKKKISEELQSVIDSVIEISEV